MFFWGLLNPTGTLSAQETIFKNTLNYSQKQGLSSPNIHKIIQDKYGFLWIATQDGLNRFDGTQFVKYNSDQKQNRQLFSSDIRDLILDNKAGLLWVVCNHGGINSIDLATGNCMLAYPYPQNKLQDQWKICAASYNNKIFIGTSGGLEIFDISSGQFTSNSLMAQSNKKCEEAFSSDIRVINISKRGIMALGLLDKGVFFYDINKSGGFLIDQKNIQKSDAGDFWPLCGQFINDSVFYCGTQNGLFGVDCKNQQSIKFSSSSLTEKLGPVTAILLRDRGDIILAGDKLAGIQVPGNTGYFIRPNFYEAESWLKNITSIFQDDKNNIWIGSRQGLCMLKNNDPVFRAVKNNPDLYANKLGHVFSLCAINPDTVLAGTKDGLFSIDKNAGLKQVDNNGLVQNIVRISKNVFIVSGYKGSRLFVNSKIEPLSVNFPELAPYQSWQFNSFVKINDSISLLGSESNNGVLEWNTHTSSINRLYTKAVKNKQLPSDIVNSIFITRKGKSFILSDFFITSYNPVTPEVFRIKGGKAESIYMQMEETATSYWIAAYGTGLIKTDHDFNLEKVYSTGDGLCNSGLYSIFNYNDSLLFLTTNFGISVFNIKTEKFSNYFEEDGLQNNTFEEASRDTLNGFFYAGGADGFVKIIPQKIVADTNPPQLYFTKLLAEGSSYNFIDTSNLNATFFKIPSQSIQLKVFFSGIHYQNPERVLYAYKIKELGNYWINLNRQNFITLIGLSPGTYHLQVQAFNEDGVPSDIKELTLIFLPKWYQTWLFKTLIALSIIAIGYVLFRMRINQLKKEQRIRSKLASDLHDDLGSTMNSVKVYANLAIMEKQADKYLPLIKEGSQEAITGIRDIIWVLDDSKDSMEQLLSRIGLFASPLCEANHIQYKQELSDHARNHKLKQEERRNLYMMLKEAVNNAIKYSHAQTISIDVSIKKGNPVILIKDDGKGFDTSKTTEGNGLKNMRRRAGEIKYHFRIESSAGSGTTIHFEKI